MKTFAVTLIAILLSAGTAFGDDTALKNGQKVSLKDMKAFGSDEKAGKLVAPITLKAGAFSLPLKVGGELRYRIKDNSLVSAVAAQGASVVVLGNTLPIKDGTSMGFNDQGLLIGFLLPADQKLLVNGLEVWAKASKSSVGTDVYLTDEGGLNIVTLARDLTATIGGKSYTFTADRIVMFNAANNIGIGTLKEPQKVMLGELEIQAKSGPKAEVPSMDGSVNFNADGSVYKVYYEKPPVVTVDGQVIALADGPKANGYLSLNPKTNLYYGIVKEPVKLTLAGKTKDYKKGGLVSFALSKAPAKVVALTADKPAAPVPATLSSVPASWNGDYVEENRPGKVALRVKNGKIYLVMGSSETETFPGTSTIKYAFSYGENECTQTSGSTLEYKWTRDPATGKLKEFNSGSVTAYVKQ